MNGCLNGATSGDNVFIRVGTNGDTTSPTARIHHLSAGWKRTVVWTANGRRGVGVVFKIHMHAVAGGVANMDSERLPIVIAPRSDSLLDELWRCCWHRTRERGVDSSFASSDL